MLPSLSTTYAARWHSARACSSSIRDSAIRSRTDDWSASGLPKATRVLGARDHHRQRPLAGAERAHHVVDPAGAEPGLGGRRSRRPPRRACCSAGTRTSVELDDAVAVLVAAGRRPGRTARSSRPGCRRHDDHRLLAVGRGLGVGLAHHDQHLAARVGGAAGPPLAAVDDVLVAVALDPGLDVGRVASWPRPARSSRTPTGSAVEQRLAATAPSARRCRSGAAAPCCRCRAPGS